MFSMKIKWVRFANSYKELKQLLGSRKNTLIKAGEKQVLLVLGDDETFYLTAVKCPHQGASLQGATCEDGRIVCPWHRYGFDLKTGRGAGLYLERYPIDEREDGLYAGFEYFSWFGE